MHIRARGTLQRLWSRNWECTEALGTRGKAGLPDPKMREKERRDEHAETWDKRRSHRPWRV